MQGVMFGNKHSFHNWRLMLRSRPVISPPTPKTVYVDVPGADGSLDMTDTLTGYTQYKNRKISFEFVVMAGRAEWPAIYSEIMDALHGKVLEIVFDDDPHYFYKGRVTVGKWEAENVMASTITMTADVEPYKTSRFSDPTYKNLTVDGSRTVTVRGTRKPAVPTFIVSADMQVSFKSNTFTLAAGENIFPEIVIRQGENLFEFTGDGTVSIVYRGGRF